MPYAIFSTNPRTRRHRQPNPEQPEQAPFFSKTTQGETAPAQTAFFQPKLTIGAPNDPYEREADAVAEKVLNQPQSGAPAVQSKEISSIQRLATPEEEKMPGTNDERMKEDKMIQEKPEVQRASTPEKKEEEKMPGLQKMDDPLKEKEKMPGVQKKEVPQPEEEEKMPGLQKMEVPKEEEKMSGGAVQAKSVAGGGSVASAQLSSRIENSSGQGRSLPEGTRSEMESSIGADFSGVNVHTGSESVEMNKDLGAQAFTHGQDVYFNAGKYNPDSREGKRLLAHELTHVVQQTGGVQKKSIQRSIGDGHDLEAVRFSGVEDLENAYDDEKYIQSGAKGEAVLRIQKALIELGYPLPKFGADGDFGQETVAAIKKFQSDNSLKDDGIVGPKTMAALDEHFRTATEKKTVSYKVEEYIKLWEIRNGRKMTVEERETLKRGCIGVTAINLGANGLPNPPLDNCHSTFAKAKATADMMNQAMRLAGIHNQKAVIFSKRFWSGGDPAKFQPDKTGKVDMAGYDYKGRPDPRNPAKRLINFDYGFYDETTGKWWHANHSEPGMNVYESTLAHYSQPLLNFDRQIFCVAVSNLK